MSQSCWFHMGWYTVNHGRDNLWWIQKKRLWIRGRLVENQRPTQGLLHIIIIIEEAFKKRNEVEDILMTLIKSVAVTWFGLAICWKRRKTAQRQSRRLLTFYTSCQWAVIDGFRSDMFMITPKTDGNFGKVSAGVLFSKVVYQRKWW